MAVTEVSVGGDTRFLGCLTKCGVILPDEASGQKSHHQSCKEPQDKCVQHMKSAHETHSRVAV